MSNQSWKDHYPQEVPVELEYPNQPLSDFLKLAAQDFPNHTAVSFIGKTLSYQQLLEAAYKFANALLKMGLKKGERVGIMLPNSPQAVIGYYGALFAGGVVVQFNPMYMDREVHHQAADSGIRFMLTLDLLYSKVKKALAGTEVDKIIVTSIKDYLPFPKNLLYPLSLKKDGVQADVEYSEKVISFPKMLKNSTNNAIQVEINPHEDLALLQYTGGTTGVSKGVQLTHRNLVANTFQAKSWMWKSTPGQEVFLCALPFFHVYGMTVGMNLAVMMAGKMVILPKFNPEEVLQTIQKERPTMFPGAPTMYIALLNHPSLTKYDLSSIEACISGSAALPLEVQDKFEAVTGGKLVEGYGLTESSPVTHCNPIWGRRKNGSIGVPWPNTEAKIVDPETWKEMPIGTPGELVVRGPQVMKGYWNRPEDTASALKDGWLMTGDIASMDEEGYFYIVDRKKNIIIAGGFNIYPREIEEVLYEHPAVEDVAVLGIPDPYRGETVKAYIVLKNGKQATKDELNSFCRERLASFKVPRLYEFRTELPKTMVGKVLKRALLEEEVNDRNKDSAEAPSTAS